jgi:phosphoglycerate dehydrogenase-like enzyme
MRCAVLDDYQHAALRMADWSGVEERVDVTVFDHHLEGDDALVAALDDFEIIVLMRERTPFTRSLFERLPKLKLVVTTGNRNPSIDLVAARDHGVLTCGTGALVQPTAELTWGMIIGLLRHIPREDANVRAGGAWQLTVGGDLKGKTLGIIGLGKLGRSVARVAHAFDMEAIAWSQNLTAADAATAGARYASKDEVVAQSDVLSIHTNWSRRTTGLIGRDELRRMKPTAILVNTSRGPIVDEAALIAALSQGWIAGAALDVFDHEPLPADHPLRTLPNTLLTPHLGYVTEDNYRIFYGEAVEDILAFLDGAPIRLLRAEDQIDRSE